MGDLDRLGSNISVPIHADEDGYVGRECPEAGCQGYFKITPGTGLAGEQPYHCPYCGRTGGHREFLTRAQLEYAKSVAMHKITGAFLQDLKRLEFATKPVGLLGVGLSVKVSGRPHPIHYYREQQLETEIICDKCGLRYAIYGVFGYCPDCGVHNSLQMLTKNLELIRKMLDLSTGQDESLSAAIVANALEDAVAALDGFGREACCLHAGRAADPAAVERLPFQNLQRARRSVSKQFGFDIAQGMTPDQWVLSVRCFQKRHLLAHRMGVVDEEYLRTTGDPAAVVGRKVQIDRDEVIALAGALEGLGAYLWQQLNHSGYG